jgi:hypothetical protein
MDTSLNNSAWLQWMESLMGGSRHAESAIFPSDRYYCLLDELPLHLLPKSARRTLAYPAKEALFFNPQCTLRDARELPQEFGNHSDLLAGFARQGMIAWVHDPNTAMLLPFWLGVSLSAMLAKLRLGDSVPSSIPLRTRSLLAAAGIFLPMKPIVAGREQSVRNAAVQFQENDYAALSGLIHPFHVAALRRYYRHQIRTGAIHLGDRQSERRYIAHNEPVARFFHHQLASTLSQLAGMALKPSYVYLASYLSGAELKKHTDRKQCDFSITLSVDFSPEPELASPWPIRLQTSSGMVTVYQALGDGLAYRGTRLPHFRAALPEGQTSTSIFFHYVSENFEGSLD